MTKTAAATVAWIAVLYVSSEGFRKIHKLPAVPKRVDPYIRSHREWYCA